MAAFLQAATAIDWTAIASLSNTIDDCALSLQSTLLQLLDFYLPFRVIRVRSTEPSWMKPSLKILLNQRDRAYKEEKWIKYFRLREEAIRHEKFLKTRHLQEAISSRNFWKAVNTITRRSKSKSAHTNITAEDLSAYFSSVFQPPTADEEPPSTSDLLSQHLVLSVGEVESELRKIKRKSSGPDGIPFWTLRTLAPSMAPAITVLFNRSLAESRVPSCFKLAHVCPLPKCSDANNVSHFRPISLLSILSKTLERLVAKKWISPLLHNVDDSQFAYLSAPGRGTTCATSVQYLSILRHLDQASGAVRVLSVDFAKAFDKLPHKTILTALTHLKPLVEVVAWVRDFLTNRFQRVSYKSNISGWRTVTSGVPQGSVLGPLLFCAVVASLQPLRSNSIMVKYADDITVLHFIRESHEDALQEELNNIISWSRTTGLPLNISKSAVMDIVTKSSLRLRPLTDETGSVFPSTDQLKLLGVIFTKDLRWDAHFQDVVRRASKRIFVIRNLRRSGCQEEAIWRVYQATIQSLLLYSFPCFCNAPQRLMNTFLKIEKRVSRIIIGDRDKHYNFVSLDDAGSRQCQRLFLQVLHNEAHPLRTFFEARRPTARNPRTLRRPMCRTTRFSNSFLKFCD